MESVPVVPPRLIALVRFVVARFDNVAEFEPDEIRPDLWQARATEAGVPLEEFLRVARCDGCDQRGESDGNVRSAFDRGKVGNLKRRSTAYRRDPVET